MILLNIHSYTSGSVIALVLRARLCLGSSVTSLTGISLFILVSTQYSSPAISCSIGVSQGSVVHSFSLFIPPLPLLNRMMFSSSNMLMILDFILLSHHQILHPNLRPLNPVWLCCKFGSTEIVRL